MRRESNLRALATCARVIKTSALDAFIEKDTTIYLIVSSCNCSPQEDPVKPEVHEQIQVSPSLGFTLLITPLEPQWTEEVHRV